MVSNDDRFTAGDGLTEGTLEHAAHLAMMSNELNGGRGAYRIANAELGASGPSYGPFQYDLGANTRARELFEEIATTAVDASGNRFISDQDLASIRSNLYQPFSRIESDAAAQGVYERLLPAMNAALSSDTGRRLINEDYIAGLTTKVESTNSVIASIPVATNRVFLEQNRLAQLIVLDTANQYGSAVNNGLQQFMGMDANSDPMQMPGRRESERIGVSGEFGLEEMIRYKLETQYGQTDSGARDVLRRISNLVDAAGTENIALSDEDRRFLESGLRQYLVDNNRNPEMLKHPALQGLRDLGMGTDRTLKMGDSGPDVAALQESLRRLGYSPDIEQSGAFDAATQTAVASLQRDMGLSATGTAGQEVTRSVDQCIRALQHDLGALGYRDGRDRALVVDGDFGGNTSFALQALQRDSGLEPTGIVDRQSLEAIAARLPDARTARIGFDHASPSAATESQDWGPFTPDQVRNRLPLTAPGGLGSPSAFAGEPPPSRHDDRPPGNEIPLPLPTQRTPIEGSDPILMEQMRERTRGLDRQAGKPWDDHSERLAASGYYMAVSKGFVGGDDLRLAFNRPTDKLAAGELLFVHRAGTNASPDPAANRASMPMTEVLAVAPEARYEQADNLRQAQLDAQLREQQEVLARGPEEASRRNPTMG